MLSEGLFLSKQRPRALSGYQTWKVTRFQAFRRTITKILGGWGTGLG